MKNYYKIISPCDRFNFFQKSMVLFVLQLVFGVTFWILTTYVSGIKSMLWLTPLFLIFIELPLLYLYFVLSARRIWSILGVFKISIFLAVILFILSLMGFIYFPVLAVLIYIMFLLLPERDVHE